MNLRFLRLTVIVLTSVLIGTACQAQAATPPVDTMATAVAQVAFAMLTQTAVSRRLYPASRHPPRPPTITMTPSPTETETIT
jgi:hypothetical protein